jgi:hypothetical protein
MNGSGLMRFAWMFDVTCLVPWCPGEREKGAMTVEPKRDCLLVAAPLPHARV